MNNKDINNSINEIKDNNQKSIKSNDNIIKIQGEKDTFKINHKQNIGDNINYYNKNKEDNLIKIIYEINFRVKKKFNYKGNKQKKRNYNENYDLKLKSNYIKPILKEDNLLLYLIIFKKLY
jgi:hypothetical protein